MTMAKEGYWDYRNPVGILFGRGRLSELPSLVGKQRTLLVTTAGSTKRGLTERVQDLLGAERLRVLDHVQPTPDFRDIENDCQALVREPIEVIVGLGGGSALDVAKSLGFLLSVGKPTALRDHFEGGAELPQATPLPLIAVPTTAGTGSEVTPFATIWDKQRKKKYSLTTKNLHPRVALLDPELTLSVPKDVTITTGLDALSQAFEAIWNRNATPITTAYATKALGIVLKTLPKLANALESLEYRTRMMEAGLLSGLAISQTRTALAHSMSYPITAHYGVPHGLACCFTLPALLDFNAQADDGRLAEVAEKLGFASVPALRYGLVDFLNTLGVDALMGRYIGSTEDLVHLVPEMLTPSRANNNLRPANVEDIERILLAAGEAALGLERK